MKGLALQEVCDAIAEAFTEHEAIMAVRELMNVDFNRVVEPGAWDWRVFNLVTWADRNGREVELLQALGKSRPKHAKMRELYRKSGMSIPAFFFVGGADDTSVQHADAPGGFERIVQDHLGFEEFDLWLERMTQVSGNVCLIELDGAAQGTGFLVGEDLVLTNYHVIEPVLKGVRKPSGLVCVFDFKKLPDHSTFRTPVKLHPTAWQVDASPYSGAESAGTPDLIDPTADELDYSIIRLAEAIGSQNWAQRPDDTRKTSGKMVKRGWLQLPAAAPSLKSPMGIIIAQHPAGFPLKLAIDTHAMNQTNGLWLNAAQNRLRYATNTLGGSSGSPVFDLHWNLIAMHHYGDSSYNHKPQYNQGVPIHLIQNRLERLGQVPCLGSPALAKK